MALSQRERQEAWVATTAVRRSPGHPFYKKLNQHLAEAGLDESWSKRIGRPTPTAAFGNRVS